MKKYIVWTIIFIILSVFVESSCQSQSNINKTQDLQRELTDFIKDKDATIGIAVIIDDTDTVVVNGDRPFPMLSVYKLPIVIALGDYLRSSDKILCDPIKITKSDLKPDTYSPMRDKYKDEDSINLTLNEIMSYALQQSDNNASDILLNIIGGPDRAMLALNRLGIKNVNIITTEDEMHKNPELCYKNSATPIAVAKMINEFDRLFSDPFSRDVKQLMETCETGKNRLVKPVAPSSAVIGHKTGTGFILPNGRIMAVNDAGYVHLTDGRSYSIAVFVEDSGYSMVQTEAIISDISELVFNSLN